MTSYHRPDDGVAQAAEMVEIRPGQFVNREVARQLGLAIDGVRGGRREIRAEAPAVRASEVVGGFGGDCSAIVSRTEPLPVEGRVNKPPVVAEKPGLPQPRRSAGRSTPPSNVRDSRRDGTSPECAVAPPAAPAVPKVKRSLREILAAGR